MDVTSDIACPPIKIPKRSHAQDVPAATDQCGRAIIVIDKVELSAMQREMSQKLGLLGCSTISKVRRRAGVISETLSLKIRIPKVEREIGIVFQIRSPEKSSAATSAHILPATLKTRTIFAEPRSVGRARFGQAIFAEIRNLHRQCHFESKAQRSGLYP